MHNITPHHGHFLTHWPLGLCLTHPPKVLIGHVENNSDSSLSRCEISDLKFQKLILKQYFCLPNDCKTNQQKPRGCTCATAASLSSLALAFSLKEHCANVHPCNVQMLRARFLFCFFAYRIFLFKNIPMTYKTLAALLTHRPQIANCAAVSGSQTVLLPHELVLLADIETQSNPPFTTLA